MKLLIFDNYDSFTFNLVHLIEKCSDLPFEVHRNDKISITDVAAFDKILLSPGPGLPKDAGILKELISVYGPSRSILGVCLGQQAIAEVFGARLRNLGQVVHGVATPIHIVKTDPLFDACAKSFHVGRYHSWIVDPASLPGELETLAVDDQQQIMALRHKHYDIRGVQFHPESILSEYGEQIIGNWLNK